MQKKIKELEGIVMFYNELGIYTNKYFEQRLSEELSRDGYEVATTKDGYKALEKLKQKYFNIVITAVKMTEMNGIDLLQKVRNKWTDTEVILIATHGTIPDATKAIKLGAFHYIEKSPELNKKGSLRFCVVIRKLLDKCRWGD